LIFEEEVIIVSVGWLLWWIDVHLFYFIDLCIMSFFLEDATFLARTVTYGARRARSHSIHTSTPSQKESKEVIFRPSCPLMWHGCPAG